MLKVRLGNSSPTVSWHHGPSPVLRECAISVYHDRIVIKVGRWSILAKWNLLKLVVHGGEDVPPNDVQEFIPIPALGKLELLFSVIEHEESLIRGFVPRYDIWRYKPYARGRAPVAGGGKRKFAER